MKIGKSFARPALRTALLAAGAALAGLILLPRTVPAATGPPLCAPPAALSAFIRSSYGEALRIRARVNSGVTMEIYVAPDGAWTMVVTDSAPVRSCAVAAGTEWNEVSEPSDDSRF